MTNSSKTSFGVFLLLLACLPGLTGCRTFNALAGMNSPTVPPPATGSYKIPGVDGATQPYYTPSGASGSSAPSGQWLPIQSRATIGADSTQWASNQPNTVRTVGYDSAPNTGRRFATTAEAEQNIQNRLAAEQVDSVSVTTPAPGQLPASNEAQPLVPTPSVNATVSHGQPATQPLATPSFQLPTQQSQPIGSGISNPPPSNEVISTGLNSPVPTPPVTNSPASSPLGNPQPTVLQNPVSTPPNSPPSSTWTSQSNPSPSQPSSLPGVGASTSFRPRVKSQ